MSTQTPDLRTAAQAVIDRWETPLWKDAPATAGYIAALRDALAADHTEHHLEMVGRWYMVTQDGMATLCVDREDAEAEARKADMAYPRNGPHRAVQLVEAQAGARPTPAHIEAMERAWLWMENQADSQSKGNHATFDLMMLREERDALRAAIDAAPTTQAAPQQEAQEPVAVIGAGFTIFWAGHGPIAPIVERHALKVGSPLYAALQPSPAAQGDALDAARYRYLRDVPMDQWPAELLTAIRLQKNAKWDAAIDAARKQGANHD